MPRRPTAALTAALLVCILSPAAGAPGPHLPPGSTIAGIDVSGLGPFAARVALERALRPVYERPILVLISHRRTKLASARAGQTVHYVQMVEAALAQSKGGRPAHVRLERTIDGRALSAAVAFLGRPFFRAPRNARARLGITRIDRTPAHFGRAVDGRRLRAALLAELRRPHAARRVRGRLVRVRPRVTSADLRRIYSTVISVDRPTRRLRLFKRLRLARIYPVAVGAAGFDTPAGLHHVISKEVNPTWHVPNRPWAGSLAGMTIPPGDARNPLKARFLALGAGVGIHGTADLASIGQAASHGCIRMRIPDVIRLFDVTPVGTPVLIR